MKLNGQSATVQKTNRCMVGKLIRRGLIDKLSLSLISRLRKVLSKIRS